MIGKCPCRGCEERILLCHSRCERYQTWKKDYEEAKPDYRGKPEQSRALKKHIWRKWLRR